MSNNTNDVLFYKPLDRIQYSEYLEDIETCFFETLQGYGATDNYESVRIAINSLRRNLKTENLFSPDYIKSIVNGLYGAPDEIYASVFNASRIESSVLLNFINSFIIRLDSRTAGYNNSNGCFECNIALSFIGEKLGIELTEEQIKEHNVYPAKIFQNRITLVADKTTLLNASLVNRLYYAIIILHLYAPIHITK